MELGNGEHSENNMRVLFLTNIPSPNRVAFFNELGKLCELTVTFELCRSSERDKAWIGEKIKYFKPIYLKGKQTAIDAALCLGILKYIHKGWDHIIIGTYNTPTSMIAMQYMIINGIPYWLEADGGFIKQDNCLKYRIKRHFISHANAWLSTGKMTTEYLCHYGAKRDRCKVFPFTSIRESDITEGAIPQKKDRETAKQELRIVERYVILYLGEFIYDEGCGKGYDTLLEVSEKFIGYDVGFYIIVDRVTQEFVDWKERKGLNNIHFVPFKTNKELTKYYVAANIFLLLTREDGWERAVSEAMTAALPIIMADRYFTGTERNSENQNGFIVNDDANEIAKYINVLLEDEELRLNYGRESYRRILNYTLENMSETNITILSKIKDQLKEYAKQRLGLENAFTFLCVSQVIYRKGIDVLLGAAGDITDGDYHVCIVGGNAAEDMNYDKAHVTFYGFKNKSELYDFYRAADAFILPTREDIWGLVINEAMAFGLPVITTDRCVAGMELVDGNGKIVKSGNQEELVNVMKMYIKDDKIYRKGCQSLKNIKKYTLENMAETHVRILKNHSNYIRKDNCVLGT